MLFIKIKVLCATPWSWSWATVSPGDELQHLLWHPVSSGRKKPQMLYFSFVHFPLDGHSQAFLFDCILQQRNEKRIILSQIVSLYLEMLKKTDMSKPHIKNLSEQLNTLRDTLSDDYKKFKDLVDLSNLQVRLFPCLQGTHDFIFSSWVWVWLRPVTV